MVITFNQKEYQKLNDKSYQLEKRRLQIELLKLQEDVIRNKRRICIVLEGRDTAGKSSAYKFFTQYLIPKNFKYVNLGIPTKWESSHWFQRWKKVIPKKGEIAFLDRSWYTRALTEPVMGYCSEKQYRDFMNRVIPWEQNLIDDGVEIIKFYFSLSQDQQKRSNHFSSFCELINQWNFLVFYRVDELHVIIQVQPFENMNSAFSLGGIYLRRVFVSNARILMEIHNNLHYLDKYKDVKVGFIQ